ncbi:unnamed protein product [Mytilus edulis]|uniref:Reverse transcriptase domain-containing protein n=1 Tax=Mytilus edulis TaxID=6550 RepID=A0A8S3SMV3_MYTED|nr:unnamed protein product [Mytilus edulis]
MNYSNGGIYRQDLRDFQLVSKRDNPTFRAFSEASVGASKDGVKNGFHLCIKFGPHYPVNRENYSSAFRYRSKVENQIKKEIELGNYIVTKSIPTIVSSLGAVPKPNGDIRLIHDASQPIGISLNSYTSDTNCAYMDMRHALKLIKPNSFLAKIDLKSAYRSVCCHVSDHNLTGLKWTFLGDDSPTYMFDSKLPFGHSRSPKIFQKLSEAVCIIMKCRYNITCIAYLDDFLVIEDTMFNCNRGLHLLIRTLRELGYNINWSKVEGPAQRITFLGIIIDTRELTLTMPPEKQSDFYNLLLSFQKRKRASIKQIQSLCGKLNWACQMVKGGRTFLRRLINSISSAQNRNDKVLLNSEFEADISWWLNFMSVFNGTVKFIDFKPITSLQTDASSLGGGGYYNGDYFYVNWAIDFPVFRKEHINIKETLAVVLSVLRWGHLWQNKTVIVLTDNMTTKCILNKGSTKNNVLMSLLRDLFWLSARYNFDIKGKFLSGRCNIIADAASRLHEEGQLSRLYDILTNGASRPLDLEITVGRLKTKGWAESTSGTYRTHLKTYVQFCEEYEFKAVPCDEKTVEFYVAYLVDKKHFAYSSIRSYINIISILHKMHNLQDPISNSWNIKHLLTGVKRELGTNQSCKAPVTPELLLSMKKVLDMSNHNNIVFWAACLTGFFGFLRPNNFLVKGTFNPEFNLRRIDVLPCSWGMLVRLKVIKTLQFRSKPIEVVLPHLYNHPLCPVAAMSKVLALVGEPLDPLFRLSDTSCLTYTVFLNAFRFTLQLMKLDHLSYGGHSFRRGAATWGSKVGLSDDDIKLLGYWSSDCFSRYIDCDMDKRLKAISTFSTLLPR